MTRSLLRLLGASLLAITLIAGGTSSPAGATSGQRQAPAGPSAACQAKYDSFLGSATKYNAKTKQVKRDNRRIKRQEAKAAKAKNAKQERRANRKAKKATKAKKRHTRQQARLKAKAVSNYTTWQDCEAAEPGTGGSGSPVQVLCDNDLPQEVCDVFDTLPVPAPGEAGDSPIQALCDNGLPQELCDAATLPGTDGNSPLQPLCDVGLPQEICDASVPGLPTDPDGPVLDPLCTLLPGLCP